MKNIFLGFVLFLGTFSSFAGDEKYMNYISSGDVVNAASFQVNDAKFSMMQAVPNWELLFTNYSVKNRVILEFDKNNPQVLTDFTVDVELFIEYTDEDLVDHSTTEILSLEYFADPSLTIIDRSSFIFEGAHQITVTILSITGTGTIPPNLQVRSEIMVERYYAFDHNDVASNFGYNYTTGDHHVELFWDPIDGVEEYDLEWVYINDYTTTASYKSAATIPYNYYKNSTRITTGNTNYSIPAIFDHGYLIFRVRGISRQGTDYSYKYYGDWSAPESGTSFRIPRSKLLTVREYGLRLSQLQD